jgi:Flp pilus assembly protein TadD
MRPRIGPLLGFLALPLLLSACAGPMTEEETSLSESMTRSIQAQSRESRDNIERQDILTQATFWAKEHENNPADREAALKLARLVRIIGNPGRGATIGSQALSLFPDDRDLLLVTGQALIEDGHPGNAVSFLQAALKADPTDASVLSALGVAYDQSDRHSLAMQTFKRAIAMNPEDPKILSNIGISYALQGEPEIAETWLRRASSLPTADAQVRQNLALVLGLQGRFDEAEELAAVDMPDGIAKENVAFVKGMITRPQAWNALRGDDQ